MKRQLMLAALMVVLVACNPSEELAEEILESQEGIENVEIDEDSGSVEFEVQDEDGTVSGVVGGGEIPDDFPIPSPTGGVIQSVFESGDEANVQLYYDGGSFDSIKQFYVDWAEGSSGEVTNTFETSSPLSYGVTVNEGDRAYTVSISEISEQVFVNLFVGSG